MKHFLEIIVHLSDLSLIYSGIDQPYTHIRYGVDDKNDPHDIGTEPSKKSARYEECYYTDQIMNGG